MDFSADKLGGLSGLLLPFFGAGLVINLIARSASVKGRRRK